MRIAMIARSYLAVLPLCGVFPPCFGSPIDNDVRNIVANAIRWQAYWEGSASLGIRYHAGERVEGRQLQEATRTHVFIAAVNVEIEIVKGSDGRVASVGISTTTDLTNADAVASFMARLAIAGPSCAGSISSKSVHVTGVPRNAGKVLPSMRTCPSEEGVSIDETFAFVLPQLTSPSAIQKKVLPTDKNILVTAVRQYLSSSRSNCAEFDAVIPFYSNTDPRVYILLRSRGVCPKGVATFSRSVNGNWEFGKFFMDVPREELADVISRIEANVAITVSSEPIRR